MPLVFAAIAPHGGDVIEEIADDPETMRATRAAMQELGRRCAAARPETIVVLNPHGVVVQSAVTVGIAEMAYGVLAGKRGRRVEVRCAVDNELAEAVCLEGANRNLPLMPVANRLDKRDDPPFVWLDWGALVPLWFTARSMKPQPRVVILAPDRSLSREALVRVGVAIARSAAESDKRIALIASCDQGHAHDPDGQYGYHPAAAEHDRAVCEAIAADDLPRLLDWPESFMEEAKVDAYWQMLMLMGALGHTPMRGELLSYEAPTYFGMAVAAYSR